MYKSTRNINILGYSLSITFLIIHIIMLILFKRYDVQPMVYFNIFSIIFYFFSMLLLLKNWLFTYVILIYLEVVIHMSLAVIFVGSGSGFQVTLIGLNILAFYSEYLSISLDLRRIHGIILCTLGMFAYLGSYAYSNTHVPPYELPAETSFWLQIAWGITVFLINILILELFVRITTTSESRLKALAKHDPLTGLYNRSGYEECLSNAELSETILLLVDIDHFKLINDSFGHKAGDLILKKLAENFRTVFRSDDYICRIGGDEFAIIIKNDKIPENIIKSKIERINQNLSIPSEDAPTASISAGAASGSSSEDLNTLFRHADRALYTTKQNGRSGISFYHE